MTAANHDCILILDFGSQVTQLIARRVREANVYCEVHPCDLPDAEIRRIAPKGVILSGSHMSAYEASTDRAPQAVFELGVPVLDEAGLLALLLPGTQGENLQGLNL